MTEANQQPAPTVEQAAQAGPATGPEVFALYRGARDGAAQPQPEPAPQQPLEVAETVPDTTEQPEGPDVDETEVQDAETEDGNEAESEAESDDESVEDEPAPEAFRSVEELAEAVDLDLDAFLDSITIETKVAGKVENVTLADLKAEAQKNKDYERRKAELTELKTQHQERQKQNDENTQQSLAYMGQLAGEYAGLLEVFNGDYLDDVRSQLGDDAYRVVRQIHGRMSDAHKKAVEGYQAVYQKEHGNLQKRMEAAAIESQREAMNLVPALRDEKTAPKVFEDVRDYMVRAGYSVEEVNKAWSGAFDPRIFAIIHDAATSNRQKRDESRVKRKLKKLPPKTKAPSATRKTPGMAEAAKVAATRELMTAAGDQPKNTRLQKAAGMEIFSQYRKGRSR